MIPQISGIEVGNLTFVRYPSNTYRLLDPQIVGNVDGIEAIKQAVFHILSTERYAYDIYSRNYGVELEKYIGRSFEYCETTIQNTLRDALYQDDRIQTVIVTNTERVDKSSLLVEFTVVSDNGTFGMEVTVNV